MCAIGKDGNDDMFQIAFTVAEAETRKLWEWFINILVNDIYIGFEGRRGWTIMSDRHKIFGVINFLCAYCVLFLFFVGKYILPP